MRTWLPIAMLVLVAMPALAQPKAAPPPANPFFAEWKTPFGVPPFDQIKPEHYLPAYEEGFKRQRAEVERIATAKAAPTFANTIEALDASGRLTEKVDGVFSNLRSSDTNDQLQAIAREVAPKQAALRDDILLNEKLFARVKAVWEKRAALKLSPEQAKLLDDTYKRFVRGGANLDAAHKERLRAINKELSLLSVTFADNLLKDTNAFRLVIDKKEDLAGLPDRVVAGGAAAAKAAGLEGKWVFGLQAPSIWPFLQSADNRELRRQILAAYVSRCDHGDSTDNKAIVAKVAALRAEKAEMLGYKTHADFVLEERMARSPDKVYGLLDRVWKPALVVTKRDIADYQAVLDKVGPGLKLEPADWGWCAEKVRKARYDLDESALRPYFKLDDARAGAFYLANRLYGLTFTERKDLPVYNPEVKAFEVKDKDGSFLGVFYADYHPRPGKRGGAWSSEFRQQCFRDGKDVRPVVVNVLNFSPPAGDAPALLSLDEVQTLFHEFGHALNALLSRIHYGSLGDMPRDFVELPSQIMENWVLEPEMLKVYAKHWQTGEVIPDALIEKIRAAQKFDQGFATVEYVAASYLDMDWSTLTEPKEQDVHAFENAAMAKIGLPGEIWPRYRSPYFQHIFAGGYSAGYYGYLWSEVLDSDAFEAFKEKGLFDQATATSFRKNILEKAGSEDAMAMWLAFRGREPQVEPLLRKRGLD